MDLVTAINVASLAIVAVNLGFAAAIVRRHHANRADHRQ